ncbi:MAG: lipoate--protein ligase [Pseudomonadota bacterium]
MSKPLRILRTNITNPWFNLATENWIFRDLDPETETLFLWRNSETVVIGAYQNPWVECKVDQMEADGVFLARRQSGGGAVYQDLGNTNFTFLSTAEGYSTENNYQILINALSKLGITAEKSGRNDILVEGQKISGSAFRRTTNRSFHHGTLLIGADLAKLSDYLNPNPLKLEAKGIKSVRARVGNLSDFNTELDHEAVCAALMESFCEFHGETVEPEWLDDEVLQNNSTLNTYYEEFADWDWRFGRTPEFNHKMEERFEWGLVTLHLQVKNAVIEDAKVFSDALDTDWLSLLQECLIKLRYSPESVRDHLSDQAQRNPEYRVELGEVAHWIVAQIREED